MDRAPPICDLMCIGTTHVSGAREAEGEGGQALGRAGLLGGVWSVGRGWGWERPDGSHDRTASTARLLHVKILGITGSG